MALEEDVKSLTAAVVKLTELMAAKPAAAVATTAAPSGRGPGRPKKITIDEVKAVATKVADEKGRPVYFQFLKQFDAKQLAELDESKYPAFMAAAEVLLAQQDEPEPAEADAEL